MGQMRRWQAVAVLVVAVAVVAVPATAAITSPHAKTSAKKKKRRACRTTHIRGRRVLLCRGFRGPRGFTGATGPRGATGARGPRGLRGFRGFRGATGPAGPTGPAGTARAYALVNPAPGGTPSFVQAANFTGIRRVATGTYCLTAGGGLTPAQSAGMVAPELGFTASGVTPYPILNARSTDCSSTEYEVRTFNGANVSAPTDGAAFSIAVA
jgi:hypothetical protein